MLEEQLKETEEEQLRTQKKNLNAKEGECVNEFVVTIASSCGRDMRYSESSFLACIGVPTASHVAKENILKCIIFIAHKNLCR